MMRNSWFGTLTVQNIDEVAARLKAMLDGKHFTTVHVYEYKRYEPEVRLHQRLEGGRNGENLVVVHHHLEPGGNLVHPHSQMIINDTYGVGGYSTSQVAPGYDPEFNSPYFIFDHNKVTITDRAPNGLLYYAVYVVED